MGKRQSRHVFHTGRLVTLRSVERAIASIGVGVPGATETGEMLARPLHHCLCAQGARHQRAASHARSSGRTARRCGYRPRRSDAASPSACSGGRTPALWLRQFGLLSRRKGLAPNHKKLVRQAAVAPELDLKPGVGRGPGARQSDPSPISDVEGQHPAVPEMVYAITAAMMANKSNSRLARKGAARYLPHSW